MIPSDERKVPLHVTLSLGVVFCLGIMLRAGLPSIPFADRDTWGFLYPALSDLLHHVFCHTAGREFPYPLFIDQILKITGTLNAIPVVQHTLGVLGGLLLWLTWLQMGRFFSFTPPLRTLHLWLGMAMVTAFLLSTAPLHFEHSIRPEAIFHPVAISMLYCATRFCVAFFLENSQRKALGWGFGLVTLAFAMLFIKGAFGLAALAAIAPVLIALLRKEARWGFRLAVFFLPLLLVFVCLWYPEHRLVNRFDPNSRTFANKHLFAFQARIIRKVIADELAGRLPTAYDRALLQTVAQKMDLVLNTPTTHYRSLGFDADNIIYSRPQQDISVVDYLQGYFPPDAKELDRFFTYYYKKAWRYYPLEMLQKIVHQITHFYADKSPFEMQTRNNISIAYEADHGLQGTLNLESPLTLFDSYIAQEKLNTQSKQVIHQNLIVSHLNEIFSWLYRICAALSPLLVAWLAIGKHGSFGIREKYWKISVCWFLYLMSYGFFNTLTLAIGHSLDVRRYVTVQLSYSLLSVGCGVMLMASLIQKILTSSFSQKKADEVCASR